MAMVTAARAEYPQICAKSRIMSEVREQEKGAGSDGIRMGKEIRGRETGSGNIHEGHRDRMRRRFERSGFDHFSQHEALEMLLYYCVPRRDTNELAHELLRHFDNSLSAVFDATVSELTEVSYISYNAAILIKMIPELARLYTEDRVSPGECIKSSEDAKAYFRGKLFARESERLMVAYLDNGGKIISCDTVSEGTVNAARTDMSRIIGGALTKRAAGCVIAHNHPHGTAFPSAEDVESTKRIKTLLDEIGVNFYDHIIVGEDDEAVSMAESYKYGYIFKKRDPI